MPGRKPAPKRGKTATQNAEEAVQQSEAKSVSKLNETYQVLDKEEKEAENAGSGDNNSNGSGAELQNGKPKSEDNDTESVGSSSTDAKKGKKGKIAAKKEEEDEASGNRPFIFVRYRVKKPGIFVTYSPNAYPFFFYCRERRRETRCVTEKEFQRETSGGASE